MTDVERMPWRPEDRLARVLGMPGDLEIWPGSSGTLPILRCVLARPAKGPVSLILRVHSRAGIPVAQATVEVHPGDQSFDATLSVMSMEGYRHLGRAAREDVERRVWSRRAFATGSLRAS
jgi:hypothetical protein